MATLKSKITTFLRTEKTKRDALQALIVECLEHAKSNDNAFDNLSLLVRGLIELKSRNCDAIRSYIGEHVTNVQWTKVTHKGGKVEYMYKKAVKAELVEYKEITYPWFNHGKNLATNTNKELDVIARAKSLLTTLTKGMDEHTIKTGQEDQAQALIASLNALLSGPTDNPVIVAKPVAKKRKVPANERQVTAVAK
jgi:hypothetical protein